MKLKLFIILISFHFLNAQTVLFFVSHEETYYSEYIVMARALEASGYTLDIRSAANMDASTYMLPNGTDIEATANTLAGSSYADFTAQFSDHFGSAWNSAWNATPATIAVNGRIQDVVNMDNYAALVIAGGTGSLAYRVDGNYSSQGTAGRLVSAADIQAAAEKLNSLAMDALGQGKPILAQCHAASLPVFWRISGTSGPGEEALGYSVLKDHQATGYPESQTATALASLDVQYKADDRVTVSSPYLSSNHDGQYQIITSRDWYPQTVAHAAKTLLNVLETYPRKDFQEAAVEVLILHGGSVNTSNCSASNRSNDVPCNYGTGADLPADYTHLMSLLNENSNNDAYTFHISELNLSGSLPFNASDENEILNYLNDYQCVIFFKHWSTFVTDALQNAMVEYADQGGGLVALHHGLYNDIDGALDKDILVQQLFGAESAMNTWSANRTSYSIYNSNYGHYITTFGIAYGDAVSAPSVWTTNALASGSNFSYSTYQNFGIYDELYNNMTFINGQSFGNGVNDITPLLSNNQTPASQCHTSGFAKRFNADMDPYEGRLVYFEAGERPEIFTSFDRYGQMVRNAVVWTAQPKLEILGKSHAQDSQPSILRIQPNPVMNELRVEIPESIYGTLQLLNAHGIVVQERPIKSLLHLDLSQVPSGLYQIVLIGKNGVFDAQRIIKQ